MARLECGMHEIESRLGQKEDGESIGKLCHGKARGINLQLCTAVICI